MSTFIALAQENIYKLSSESYIDAKVAILDVIINSPEFDSINKLCNIDTCRFLDNEEFYEEVIIRLKEKNATFTIINESQRKDLCHWSLDFYINPYLEDPKEAIVQMEYVSKGESEVIVGIDMEKSQGHWQIKYFTFIQ